MRVSYELSVPGALPRVISPWPDYSNGYIRDVIDERIAAIRDRLADERDQACCVSCVPPL